MSYDPNRPYDGASDPYGPPPSDPYGQPSGVPYNQPQSGQPYPSDPYAQPQSGQPYPSDPYAQPASGQPYNQPASGQPYNPTAPLPPGDPYANPGGPYANPSAPPYGQPADAGYGYPGGPQPGVGYPGGPPPPPQKSKTGLIVGGIAAVVVIVIAVCGIGTWLVGRNSDDKTTTSSSGLPSTRPSTATTGPAASASPTQSADSRTLVQPAGAPYTFRVPEGYQTVKVPKSDTSTGSSSQYSSAVATSTTETNDFLIVDAYALSYDADAVDQTELGTQFDKLVKQIQQDPASRQNVTYNGNNGFWYKFDFGSSKAYSYFLFHGSNEIQVRCQWTDQESEIKRGCEDLLSSLQITA